MAIPVEWRSSKKKQSDVEILQARMRCFALRIFLLDEEDEEEEAQVTEAVEPQG